MLRPALIALVLLAAWPVVALGHAGAGAASDYRSEPGALRDASGAEIPGAEVDVIGGDDRMRLRWSGEGELVVLGYAGEPYLRIGPGGAFENATSPSVVANRERFGGVVGGEDVGGRAPSWRRIADEPVAVWHDHRTHWMSESADPPGVAADPDREQVVQEWRVDMTVDGRPAALSGRLVYVPPPSPWPWIGLAAVLALAGGLLALLAPRGPARLVARLATGVAVLAGPALAAAQSAAAPSTGLTDGLEGALPPAAQAAIWSFAALAAVALWVRAARSGPGHEAVVMLGAAWVLGGGVALARLGHLDSSILPAPLPSDLSRLVVAACLGALAAPSAWAWRALAGVRADAGGRPGPGYTRRAPTATRWGVAKR